MIYKFTKEVSYEYINIVEADSLEDAIKKLDESEWEEGSDGEVLIRDRRITVYENEDALEEDDSLEEYHEETMRENDIWFD